MNVLNVSDEPEGKCLWTETIKLYCILTGNQPASLTLQGGGFILKLEVGFVSSSGSPDSPVWPKGVVWHAIKPVIFDLPNSAERASRRSIGLWL